MEILRFENVTKRYGDNTVLDNVTLSIGAGEVFSLLGPSGCGKTTLLRICGGFEKPDSGRVILDGVDITDYSITERAKNGISYAFQQPVRFKGITVKDLISLAAGEKITVAQACEYLSEVGLCAKNYINREVDGSLSGGELKRIEIAMVNARGTKLSVFDEPEAGIDLWSFQNLIQVFRGMYERTKGTILIISHQERILDIADKVVVIADGEVSAYGNKADILPELLNAQAGCRFTKEAEK